MEKVEEEGSSGKNSYSEESESGRHDTQETKQERLDRFRAAAWHQNNVEEENTGERRTMTAEGTKPGSSDSKANIEKGSHPPPSSPRRPQRLHANSTVTVSGSARQRQLDEFVWPTDVDCTTARDDEVAPNEKPQLKRRLTRLANKESHPMEHLGLTLGGPMILLCDLIIPCIIYYTWYLKHRSSWMKDCREWYDRGEACPKELPQLDESIMGSAVACFGIGELYVLLARVWRLFFRRDQCAPLLSRSRWELDATSWVYLVAMLIALIPFVVGSSLVMPELYLYGPAFLMSFLGVLMVITTLHPFNIPIGINSHARGSGLRPFIYYAAEDFIAVDGLQDREFRVRYNERYETSKPFRRMFVWLTLWWEFGILVYIGCLSAVIWTLPFHVAFGLSLGLLFSWIATWALTTYGFVMWEMNRQRKAFEEGRDGA
jgi:hypothetical protein